MVDEPTEHGRPELVGRFHPGRSSMSARGYDGSVPGRLAAVGRGNPDELTLWSGTPAHICRALRARGVDVAPIDSRVFGERWLNAAVGLAHAPSVIRAFRSVGPSAFARAGSVPAVGAALSARCLAARISGTGASGVVSFAGAADRAWTGLPEVLVEDMTVSQIQSLRGHFPEWDAQPLQRVARLAQRQARRHRSAHRVAFLTAWAAEAAIRDYGLDRKRVGVIGVGSRFPSSPSPDRDWSVPRFLFVGKDWNRKNGPLVLRAFRSLREDVPAAELHLVGGHPSISEPGVFTYGVLGSDQDPKLLGLYRSCTAFVLPSALEPAGLAYAEACSQGLPSIATVHGGAGDVVGDAGLLVDPTVPGAVLAAMRELAREDRLLELAGRAAKRSSLLTWESVAERLVTLAGWAAVD